MVVWGRLLWRRPVRWRRDSIRVVRGPRFLRASVARRRRPRRRASTIGGFFPWWHPFFRFAVDLNVEPGDEIGPQPRAMGIDPTRDLKTLVLSHLHHDHADGLEHFKGTEILVSDEYYQASQGFRGAMRGAVPSRWPSWFEPVQSRKVIGPVAQIRVVLGPGSFGRRGPAYCHLNLLALPAIRQHGRSHHRSAVDAEGLAGDESGLIGAQEPDCAAMSAPVPRRPSGMLAAIVSLDGRGAPLRARRRDRHDATPARGDHVRQRDLAAVKGAGEVDVEHPLPGLDGNRGGPNRGKSPPPSRRRLQSPPPPGSLPAPQCIFSAL